MADIRAIEPHKYNAQLAKALKEVPEFEQPDWIAFVKTGTNRERPTDEPDFWYKRAASILRQLYIKGVVGTERLRTRYGGRKERGGKPPEFRKSSGKIIRIILQQSDSAGFTEKVTGKHAGRKLTAQGKKFLEEAA